ncbi:LysM peptidoglycan-binding domain-containing protein [Methylobacterium sp. WL12]|uniref:LysM peptidoglycan-binding domain-containing protein n=1 Tax=Methylobacterium sp. WL12 TaxID=2603890 RepID=UPI0011CAB1A6|nr:LysM peptidoglycan-binding domain-containing protein [Methylobacterium sp. WL12]TXM73695.1 LysM peptidoglycan-binding domain-containing protein [Methylobacterium sp. WL12]
MSIGLRGALVRWFLGLLVGVGVVATLLGKRRRTPDAAPDIASATPAPAAVRGRGLAVALLALLCGIGLILAFYGRDGIQRPFLPVASTADGSAAPALASRGDARMPEDGTPASGEPTVKAEAGRAAGARGENTLPAAEPVAPTFETLRIEPNGEAVVAGRSTPNGTVTLLVDGKPTAQALADAGGRFAIVPPALPAGNSELGLAVTDAQGRIRRSQESVAVAVSPTRDAKPLVALSAPDAPTRVLSQPDPAATARATGRTDAPTATARPGGDRDGTGGGPASAEATRGGGATVAGEPVAAARPDAPAADPAANADRVKVVGIDAQDGGRLFVTARSAPGSTVRLYLNDTLIAPAAVGRDGTVTFTIGRGVGPGAYKVRLDQVEAPSGKVRSRVEVPFAMPAPARKAGTEAEPKAAHAQAADESDRTAVTPASPGLAAETPAARGPSEPGGGADVFVPEVRTATIARGDSLWEISRRTYGAGDRYSVIYDANQDQIRDPDLIYPGQIFVLPSEGAPEAGQAGERG